MAKKSVPVANRTLAQSSMRVAVPRVRMDARELLVVVVVLAVVIAIVGTPLRNYLQQRSEIERLSASIAAKQEEKQRLQTEIEKYSSEDYIREQARQRLGVIAQGEVAYRVMGEGIDPAGADDQAGADSFSRPWYELLWDSVSVEPKQEVEMPGADSGENLPIVPTEAAEQPAQ